MSDSPKQPFLTTLAVTAAKRWKITLVGWIVLILAGGYAFTTGLAREGFPAINVPIVLVEGFYFVDDVEQVDVEVSQPLTNAMLDVEGVSSIETYSGSNGLLVVVEFEDAYTAEEGAVALEAVGAPAVPPEAQIAFRPLNVAKYLETYDILVSVVAENADATPESLQARAGEVQTHLLGSDAIAEAEIQDSLTAAVDPVTGDEIVRQTSFSRAYTDELGEYRPSIVIGLIRADNGQDTIAFSEAVQDHVELAGFDDVVITADFAVDIKAQLKSLQNNLLTGLVAVAAVSFLLIGWRTALVTSGFMITVVAAAFLILWVTGFTLNTITLFALILTIGLLVDDAVVIAESIDANRGESSDPLEVVRIAINRVGRASLSGSLTTVLVFMPLLFVTGIIGKFIRVMPITVIITLLASFVLSIVLISALAGAFLLTGKPSNSPIIRLEDKTAIALEKMASKLEGQPGKGFLLSLGGVLLSFIPIGLGIYLFLSLGFNVFPPSKDSNILQVELEFDRGTEIGQAEQLAAQIDEITVEVLGDDLRSSVYLVSDERSALVFLDLLPYDQRSTKSPVLVDRISERVADLEGVSVAVSQQDQGPPSTKFPFSVQIRATVDQVDAAQLLAKDMAAGLSGAIVLETDEATTSLVETEYTTANNINRSDGVRTWFVNGRFDGDDLTELLNLTEELVGERYPADDLVARGLDADALVFDFGIESENQEGFDSILSALLVALLAMIVLLMTQFRSLVQPLLIVMAIPFSFLGVGAGLSLTDNPLSFLVMIGLIGLIGVVVNNTILLTDAANQARRAGATPAAAIGLALRRRFRPLIATTITTVAGLAPLAISDPFWQPMAITIMVGLVSSTILVLLAFPFYYRAVEYTRVAVADLFRSDFN